MRDYYLELLIRVRYKNLILRRSFHNFVKILIRLCYYAEITQSVILCKHLCVFIAKQVVVDSY